MNEEKAFLRQTQVVDWWRGRRGGRGSGALFRDRFSPGSWIRRARSCRRSVSGATKHGHAPGARAPVGNGPNGSGNGRCGWPSCWCGGIMVQPPISSNSSAAGGRSQRTPGSAGAGVAQQFGSAGGSVSPNNPAAQAAIRSEHPGRRRRCRSETIRQRRRPVSQRTIRQRRWPVSQRTPAAQAAARERSAAQAAGVAVKIPAPGGRCRRRKQQEKTQ
jgi:hypothetical protein